MGLGIELAEQGLLPESLVRLGIRRLLQKRLRQESERHAQGGVASWLAEMERSGVAPVPELANAQHYEVPAELFRLVLGPQRKYSSALWPAGEGTLAEAEEAMLALTAERAQLADGQQILELGCGWGSLSLWMARRFPRARIWALSNSQSQHACIRSRAADEGLSNLTVLTADINVFETDLRFDRVVSVEMFEHLRNWSAALSRVRRWLADDGRLFLHVFAHALYAYPFEARDDDDWMGRHFFTGGMMPSADLIERVASPFRVEQRWLVDGTHYARTAEAWLANLARHRAEVEALLARQLGAAEARRSTERWRIFFMACAELFGFRGGSEWLVTHARLAPLR